MMSNGKIGAAVVGGYLLGRTKKAKLAMGVATALAGSRIKPGRLGRQLAQSPLFDQVNQQVRNELASAGKAAAATVLNAKADRLAEALHQRTESLREQTAGQAQSGVERVTGDRDGDEGRSRPGRADGAERSGHRRRGNGADPGGSGDRPAEADRARRPDDG